MMNVWTNIEAGRSSRFRVLERKRF